jgi:hypothetical protein
VATDGDARHAPAGNQAKAQEQQRRPERQPEAAH